MHRNHSNTAIKIRRTTTIRIIMLFRLITVSPPYCTFPHSGTLSRFPHFSLSDLFSAVLSQFFLIFITWNTLPRALSLSTGDSDHSLRGASLPSLPAPVFRDSQTRRAVFDPTGTVTGGSCFSALAFYKSKRSLSAPIPLFKIIVRDMLPAEPAVQNSPFL